MADADVPDKFWPAIRLVINNLVWILPLVALEQLFAGELKHAAILGIIFVIDLIVAVKWGHLTTILAGGGQMSSAQLILMAGIVGTWAFMTLGLGATAWMIWNQTPFAIGVSAIAGDKSDDGPIQWHSFNIEGDLRTKISSLRFPGVNISKTRSLQIKDANIISAIDGTLVPLEIVAVNEAGESKIVPISDVQLIPPGARIELVAKFGSPDPKVPGFVLGLEPKAFLDKWRQFSFNASDDTRTYRSDFNDSDLMVFFQGKVGPRVMVKPK